jgi:hypothetical protein
MHNTLRLITNPFVNVSDWPALLFTFKAAAACASWPAQPEVFSTPHAMELNVFGQIDLAHSACPS